jgi:hypothetical protein
MPRTVIREINRDEPNEAQQDHAHGVRAADQDADDDAQRQRGATEQHDDHGEDHPHQDQREERGDDRDQIQEAQPQQARPSAKCRTVRYRKRGDPF